MLNYLNKFSSAAWKPVCHGRGSLYNVEVRTPSYKRGSVCAFTNISSCEGKITGDRKNKRLIINALDVIHGSTKGNTDNVYFNNFYNCKFHSTYPNKNRRPGNYQDEEKRRANVLIFLTCFLLVALVWSNYKMDLSPYDKPVKKDEKL